MTDDIPGWDIQIPANATAPFFTPNPAMQLEIGRSRSRHSQETRKEGSLMDCFRYESAGLWDCRNCCSSCHDDYWEYNYPACEVEVELDHWLMVCCQLTQHVNVTDLPREFWR